MLDAISKPSLLTVHGICISINIRQVINYKSFVFLQNINLTNLGILFYLREKRMFFIFLKKKSLFVISFLTFVKKYVYIATLYNKKSCIPWENCMFLLH